MIQTYSPEKPYMSEETVYSILRNSHFQLRDSMKGAVITLKSQTSLLSLQSFFLNVILLA